MPARAKTKKTPRKPDGGSVRLPTDPDHKLSTDQLRGQLLQVAAFQAYMAVAEKGTPAGKKRNRMSDVAAKEDQQPAEAKSNVDPKTGVRQAYKAELPVGRVRLPSLPPPPPPPSFPRPHTISHATLAADYASLWPPLSCSENGRQR